MGCTKAIQINLGRENRLPSRRVRQAGSELDTLGGSSNRYQLTAPSATASSMSAISRMMALDSVSALGMRRWTT